MKQVAAAVGIASCIVLFCAVFGNIFGEVYRLALYLSHGAPESIFAPYFVFLLTIFALIIYIELRGKEEEEEEK